jgi:hypothetical protein
MAFIQVDQLFSDHLLYLTGIAAAANGGTRGQNQPLWYRPALHGWSGNPLDLQTMKYAFDRSSLNALYSDGLMQPANGATVGDMMAAKVQIDYTAVLERAFRTRHATRIRCTAHATGRKKGHSNANGIFMGTLLSHVQTLSATSLPATVG